MRLICPYNYVPIHLAVKTFIVGFIKWIAYGVKPFCKDHFPPFSFNLSGYFQDSAHSGLQFESKAGCSVLL